MQTIYESQLREIMSLYQCGFRFTDRAGLNEAIAKAVYAELVRIRKESEK